MKARLKAVATERIQRGGLAAASFRDLGAEVGIKSSSVIYHFGSKEDMVAELIADYAAGTLEEIENRIQRASTPRDQLLAVIAFFESVHKEDRFCMCGMLGAEAEHLNQRAKGLLGGFFQDLQQLLGAIMRDLGIDHPHDEAALLLSALEGALLLDRALGGKPDRLRALRRSWKRRLETEKKS